ncbi:MAG: trimeric intracellular cation channel family protein [Tissierellia bacterium]|nr:trimeric intracellular cation channel family protein [Tissierellia bacterium]
MDTLNFTILNSVFEIIGTIAFAFSGAMLGIRKEMDIFGIMVLGVVTALGGGLTRDIILGITPPAMFQNSNFALLAVLSSLILFVIFYFKVDFLNSLWIRQVERLMIFFDALGLGAFTVTGINTALTGGFEKKFLLIFVGMVTGIGGGIIRDVLSREIPFVFREQIYAIASLSGAVVYLITSVYLPIEINMILCFITVVLVRLYAIKKNLHLPRIKNSRNR